MIMFILCLALISLACLDTSMSAVASAQPSQVATRINTLPAPTATASAVETAAPMAAQLCAVVVADSAQNLRGFADVRSRILAHLRNGDQVQVLGQSNADWWQVKRGEDIGFARSIYLKQTRCEDVEP